FLDKYVMAQICGELCLSCYRRHGFLWPLLASLVKSPKRQSALDCRRARRTFPRLFTNSAKDARWQTLRNTFPVFGPGDLREWLQISSECFQPAVGLSLRIQRRRGKKRWPEPHADLSDARYKQGLREA